MRLAALQQAFQAHLLDGELDIAATLGADGARGLRVYAHAYRATLGTTLRDVFTRTRDWLGGDAFDRVADQYVATIRPTGWTLGTYGDRFSDLLATQHPDDPDVAELAWLEWHLRHSFAAPSLDPVGIAALSAVDWEQARVGFHSAVAVRFIVADVPGIWHAIGEERAPEQVLLPRTAGLIVWRDGFQPRFRTAPAAEVAAIAAMLDGASFARAIDDARDPEEAGGWLAGWLRDRLIVSVQ